MKRVHPASWCTHEGCNQNPFHRCHIFCVLPSASAPTCRNRGWWCRTQCPPLQTAIAHWLPEESSCTNPGRCQWVLFLKRQTVQIIYQNFESNVELNKHVVYICPDMLVKWEVQYNQGGNPSIHGTCNSVRVAYCKFIVVVVAPAHVHDGAAGVPHLGRAQHWCDDGAVGLRARAHRQQTTITVGHPHWVTRLRERGNYLCSSIYLEYN